VKFYDKDSGGGGSYIRDIYLRHGVYLTRFGTHEANRLLEILDVASLRAKELILKSKGIETKKKYQKIRSHLKEIRNDLAVQLNTTLQEDGLGLIDEEVRFVQKAVSEATGGKINIVLDMELPAIKQIWATASFEHFTDEGIDTFQSYLNTFSDNFFKQWDISTRIGYLMGEPVVSIARRILGSVKLNDPGQIKSLRNSLLRNTKTMISSLSATARNSVYREHLDIFNGFVWCATLDLRCCLRCGTLDGTKFTRIEDAPHIPIHPQDRCLLIPYIKGFEDISGERASMSGPVSDKITWEEWISDQPAEFQKEAMGKSRFEMFKAGTSINSFLSDGRILTLGQLRKKAGID
jgi:hypothetical protein